MPNNPQTLDAIKRDAKMMAAYMAYAKRRVMLNEVLFYFNKGNARSLYPRYIDRKAKDAVNISAKPMKAATALAEREDWDNKGWAAVLASAKKDVGSALNLDIPAFCLSPEYKTYLAKTKMGDPKKAAKTLGIDDVRTLTKAMEAQVTGDKALAKKLFEKLVKAEKLKAKPIVLMQQLEKAGLA
ncbi:MAG: hypothetical protein AAFU49_16880 [Pseudomonadota bacterium]